MSQVESQAPAYFAYISKDFIGRREEIRLFVEKILAPETPACNIFAISGGAGVGKTTLLNQFIKVAQSPDFKDDCLTALVNERWLTPMDVMRQFADQLSRAGFHLKKFEDEWKKYRDITQQQQAKQEEQQREIIDTVSKTLGSVASSATDAIATRYGMPGVGSVVGPITGDGAKVALTFMTKKYEEHQYAKEIEMSQEPHVPLTEAFVADLNAVAQPHFALLYEQDKLQRVILFLDAFGRLAPTIVPWLLDYLLPRLECNVGLVIAGRKSIEDVTPDGYSRWQRYQDNGTLYTTSLGNFSPEETKAYLNARGITDDDKIQSYRQVSQGLPYYLYLLTAQGTEGDIDPGASVVENVLRRIPREEKIKRTGWAWRITLLMIGYRSCWHWCHNCCYCRHPMMYIIAERLATL